MLRDTMPLVLGDVQVNDSQRVQVNKYDERGLEGMVSAVFGNSYLCIWALGPLGNTPACVIRSAPFVLCPRHGPLALGPQCGILTNPLQHRDTQIPKPD